MSVVHKQKQRDRDSGYAIGNGRRRVVNAAAGRNRSTVRHPVMGHHSNVTTVKSASSAYAAPLLSAPVTALPSDAIGTVVSTSITGSRRRRVNSTIINSNKNTANNINNNCTGAAAAMQNGTVIPDRSASDYYFYHARDNATETALFFPLNGTTAVGPDGPFEKPSCHWIAAQQSLFQFANICFLTAFIVPRSYKLSVLSLR